MKSRGFSILVVLLTITLIIPAILNVTRTSGVGSTSFHHQSADDGFLLHTNWGTVSVEDLHHIVPHAEGDIDSGMIIVQFKGPVPTDLRSRINELGMSVLGYIPEYSFIIDTANADPSYISELDGFYDMIPYPSGLKVMPDLYSFLNEGRTVWEIDGARSLVVELFREDPDILDKLEDIGTWTEKASSTRFVVGLPISSLDDLIAIDSVEWVEPRYQMVLHNDIAKDLMGVPYIWNTYGLTGKGQTVTIADTGIDTGVDSHLIDGDMIADLDNRITPYAWAGPTAIDTHSHGTHVAGSVAGNGSLSSGSIKGMAPEADVFFQAIANETVGNPLQIPANTSLLFKQAYDNGSRVHTNSWGASVYGRYTTSSWDVDWFLYHHPEMIILYSAGNSGIDYYKPWGTYNPDGKVDEGSIGSPATAKNCITVGASENDRPTGGLQGTYNSVWSWQFTLDPVRSDTPSDDPNGLAAFSSRGPTDDGRLKPDVVGPGTNVLSLRSTQTSGTGWGTYSGNSNYIFMGGTSMSTPLTAGTVVLIRQYYNSSVGYEKPSGALLKATLINGALDMTPGQYGTSNATTQEINRRPDNDQGWGRVNLTRSIYPEGNLAFMDDMDGLSTGESISTDLEISSSSQELRVTLAYSDHPPSMSASKQLVNDLDLWLEAPNGTRYHGNDLIHPYNDTWDDTNPVEGIMIDSPAVGTWKVHVNGSNIPLGPQHFALVANGDISNFSGLMELDSEFYSTEGDEIRITVRDQDLIGDGTVTVNVSSDSFAAGRSVVLYETGTTGSFQGSITTTNVTTTNLSLIHVADDDRINVIYYDQDPSNPVIRKATAKEPVKLDILWKDEFYLVQAEGETIHLEGSMERNITGWWRISGIDSDWRSLHDDGNSSFGDLTGDDGNYSDIWTVPSGQEGTGTLLTAIHDPFLGNRTYEHFEIVFNSTAPRYPKDLTAFVESQGNSVILDWSDTDEVDIAGYGIFTDRTLTGSGIHDTGWSRLTNTSSTITQYTISDLVDGEEYGFRVSAIDQSGEESSLSIPIFATPQDTNAPTVDLLTIPYTIVGVAYLEFTGSPDLEMVELEYYNDSNENGLQDDGVWMPAGTGHPSNFTWDTRNGSGGPGNINRMFIRYRGYDEVPNISDWVNESGFRIDNIGPDSVELIGPPPRITNIVIHEMSGLAEGDGYVLVYINDELVTNTSCDPLGGFDFEMNLSEGLNVLVLSAHDQFGAGPTNRTYHFSLDTQSPVPSMDTEDQSFIIREIDPEGYTLTSTSHDPSVDPQFAYIENITWTYREPDQVPKVFYADESIHLPLATLGNHSLTLDVRDPAGNTGTMTLIIQVRDTTPAVIDIDGPLYVDEKKPITYIANYSDNDPRAHIREGFQILWNVTGPSGFQYESHTDPFIIWFPGPGVFNVTLMIRDGGNNTNTSSILVDVSDTTPPNVDIIGNRNVILGIPETYTANVTDNDLDFPEGASFEWNLSYLEGPPSGWWSEHFSGVSFIFNFTLKGTYTLILEVKDASSNSRLFQIGLTADGDLTPPRIRETLPVLNASYQYSEDVTFTVKFNEPMNRSSINSETIRLLDPNGDPVNVTLTIRNRQGATEVTIDPSDLDYQTTYMLWVSAAVMDSWDNPMAEDRSFNYTIRTRFSLVHPWGQELETYFNNFSSNSSITLTFSNPVEPSSLQYHLNVKVLELGQDVFGNEVKTLSPFPFTLEQGDDPNKIILKADWDEGVEYNITIFEEAVDIFNYEIGRSYSWQFKTYLPPVAAPEDEEDTEKDPLPDWMNNPVYWILIAAAILFLFILIFIFGMIRRRRNLRKIWAAEEESLRKRTSISHTPVEPQVMKTSGSEDTKEEPAPKPVSYEDLYGSKPITYEPGSIVESTQADTTGIEDLISSPPPPPSPPEYTPPVQNSSGIDWDEDDPEEEWDDEEEVEDQDWDMEDNDDEEIEW